MRSNVAIMASRRSGATRRNTWMHPVRGENRSRVTWRRLEEKVRVRLRLLLIVRGTARRFAPRKRCYSGTVNWRHGTAIRRIALSPRHANIRSSTHPAWIRLNSRAVTYARNHVFERSAVQDERSILQAAISRSMAQATYVQVRNEFAQRVQRGEFLGVGHAEGRAAPALYHC